MAINKVVYNGGTLIDLTGDTVTADKLMQGYTAHDKSGAIIIGTATGGTEQGNIWQDQDGYIVIDDESEIQLQTKSATPSETAQTVKADEGYYALKQVNVGAISSSYVGSGVTRRSSTDLTVSGATVTAPSGYYSASASKSVASGTAGTPTATKGTVSNHSVSVTPSVTNTTGYITGGTKNGTAVTVAASELVSGTLNVTSSGTKDVTNYASASVPNAEYDFGSGEAGFFTDGQQRKYKYNSVLDCWTAGWLTEQTTYSMDTVYNAIPKNTSVTPTTSSQTVGGAKYVMEGAITINAMPSGTAGTPTATKGTVSNHSISVTPSVTNTTGYITGSTKTGTAVTVSASELVSGTLPITQNGTGIDVTNYASVNVNVNAGPSHTAKITGIGSSSYCYVCYPSSTGTKYYTSGDEFSIESGNVLYFRATGSPSGGIIYLNGSVVAGDGYSSVNYSYTVKENENIEIELEYGTESHIYISTISDNAYTPISVGVLEVTANITSTSVTTITTSLTIDTSELTNSKMLYVKIRDKAGKRKGYFYGTDMFFPIWDSVGGGTTQNPAKQVYRVSSSGVVSAYTPATTTCYGVYVSGVTDTGEVYVMGRYNSSYSLTINGTYSIDVYMLEWPDNVSPMV